MARAALKENFAQRPTAQVPPSSALPQFTMAGAVSLNVRIEPEISTALLRASMDRKIQRLDPFTQRDIVAEALAEWRECLEVCLDSYFLCAKRAAPVMKAQKSGLILNMSSNAGQHGFGNRTPYAAAKWGVIGLTKSLAIELGPYGCRSNAICPGSVKGDRINRVIQGEADVRGVPFEVVAKEIVNNQSLERLTEAHEVAALAVYLASPAAFMINGQDIAIDGHVETFHIK